MINWRAIAFALVVTAVLPGRAAVPEGHIIDAVTGAPVQDAYVVADGRIAPAGPSGAFVLPADKSMFVRAPGYRAATLAPANVIKLVPFKPRALYLTVYGIGSKTLRENALTLIREGAANALVIDLKGDRGIVPYPSTAAREMNPGARKITTISDLSALVRKLHGEGIYLIARIVAFKDDPLAAARPDLAIRHADGHPFQDREHMAWVDPFQPQVRNYDIALALEAARAGFDEIQFDYLRFPDTSTQFRLAQPSNSQSRVAAIAGFLADARQALVPYNVYLAADVFGYTCWNQGDTGIGQQIEKIAPNVDYLSPMLYPSGFQFGIPGVRNPVTNSYAIVRDSLDVAQTRLKISPKHFRPWLQAFRDYAFDKRLFGADEVAKQIRAADDFGSNGWMLWNAGNIYSGTGLAEPKLSSTASASFFARCY